MSTYPSVDECRDRLHRAGWSIGAVKVLQDKFTPDSGTAHRFEAEARITAQCIFSCSASSTDRLGGEAS